MPLRGSFSSGGGGASSGTSSAIPLAYSVASWTEDTEVEVSSINRGTASQAGATLIEPRVLEISFDVGWPSDLVVRVNGKDRSGATIYEDFTPPAADAGGLVQGSKVFCAWTTTTISAASAGVENASIRYRSVVPVPSAPVTAFQFLWHAFSPVTIATYDLTEGWVATTAPIAAADAVLVLYTHTPEITLA